jgi:hypothetical protein
MTSRALPLPAEVEVTPFASRCSSAVCSARYPTTNADVAEQMLADMHAS